MTDIPVQEDQLVLSSGGGTYLGGAHALLDGGQGAMIGSLGERAHSYLVLCTGSAAIKRAFAEAHAAEADGAGAPGKEDYRYGAWPYGSRAHTRPRLLNGGLRGA